MAEQESGIELRRIDLNLLVVFSALMSERSVRRAARRLLLGPSAVSMALGRLREMLDDELFVRSGSGMIPTPRALRLDQQLAPALAEVHDAVFAKTSFDPSRARGTLRFALPDAFEMPLLPKLLGSLREEAPGLRIVVRPSDPRTVTDALERSDADLALTAMPPTLPSRFRTELLYEETLELVHDRRVKTISLKQYLEAEHLLVSAEGLLKGAFDRRLAELGHTRNVVAALSHFSTLPAALRGSDLLAHVPSLTARHHARELGLSRSPLPFAFPSFEVLLVWHTRSAGDPMRTWFRERVRSLVLSFRGAR